MRLTIRELRRQIREAVVHEWAGAPPTRAMFDYVNNSLSPALSDREQLGPLADHPADDNPDEELSDHLRQPQVTPEECFGPVPPTNIEPYVQQDPLTRDTSPLPTPPIKR